MNAAQFAQLGRGAMNGARRMLSSQSARRVMGRRLAGGLGGDFRRLAGAMRTGGVTRATLGGYASNAGSIMKHWWNGGIGSYQGAAGFSRSAMFARRAAVGVAGGAMAGGMIARGMGRRRDRRRYR